MGLLPDHAERSPALTITAHPRWQLAGVLVVDATPTEAAAVDGGPQPVEPGGAEPGPVGTAGRPVQPRWKAVGSILTSPADTEAEAARLSASGTRDAPASGTRDAPAARAGACAAPVEPASGPGVAPASPTPGGSSIRDETAEERARIPTVDLRVAHAFSTGETAVDRELVDRAAATTPATATSARLHARNGPAGRDEAERRLVPGYDRLLESAAELVTSHLGPDPAVLFLGPGSGRLAELVVTDRPGARVTLLDPSAETVASVGARLAARGVAAEGVTDGLDAVPDGPFDAVVTSLSLHHLTDDDKELVYRRVHGALVSDGIFVAAEQVAGPTLHLDDLYHHRWMASVAVTAGRGDLDEVLQRMVFEHPSPVADLVDMMTVAGFRDVDCFVKDHRFAVLGGWCSSRPRR